MHFNYIVFYDISTQKLPKQNGFLCIEEAEIRSAFFIAIHRQDLIEGNIEYHKWLEMNGGDRLEFSRLENFLQNLDGPVCLVAHNNYRFDREILNKELEKCNMKKSHTIVLPVKHSDTLQFIKDSYFIMSNYELENYNLEDCYLEIVGAKPAVTYPEYRPPRDKCMMSLEIVNSSEDMTTNFLDYIDNNWCNA